jgi:hypothetical protein
MSDHPCRRGASDRRCEGSDERRTLRHLPAGLRDGTYRNEEHAWRITRYATTHFRPPGAAADRVANARLHGHRLQRPLDRLPKRWRNVLHWLRHPSAR